MFKQSTNVNMDICLVLLFTNANNKHTCALDWWLAVLGFVMDLNIAIRNNVLN